MLHHTHVSVLISLQPHQCAHFLGTKLEIYRYFVLSEYLVQVHRSYYVNEVHGSEKFSIGYYNFNLGVLLSVLFQFNFLLLVK